VNEGEDALEFLLAFHRRIHWYEDGSCIRFEIRRVEPTPERPHGLRYSFTLHDPDGARLLGFDNAHRVKARGSRFRSPGLWADHWHSRVGDRGRPYRFVDAETLIEDFFNEVERIQTSRGVPLDVVAVEERKEGDDAS
jgi:hypothetical protein